MTQHLFAEFMISFSGQSVMSIALVLNSIRPVTVSQFFQTFRGCSLCSVNYILIFLCSGFHSCGIAPRDHSISYYPVILCALKPLKLCAVMYFKALASIMKFILLFPSDAFLLKFTFVILREHNSLFLLFD